MSAQSGQSLATLRVVMAQLDFLVGDIPGNTRKVIDAAHRAEKELAADIVVFPELCLTGYPPEDLLLRPSMDLRISEALETLQSEPLGPAIVVGAPVRQDRLLYNAALVIDQGRITGRYFKRFPPNYQVFDEKRYFAEGREVLVQDIRGAPVGLTVCEDIWTDGPVSPDVLANGQPHRRSANILYQNLPTLCKIPLFIEHLIIRRKALEVTASDPALIDDQSGVVQQTVLPDRRTDHNGGAKGFRLEGFQRLGNPKVHAGAQQKILGRVTGQAELRKDDNIGGQFLFGAMGSVNHFAGITRNVAHQKIELCHYHPKRCK